MKSKTTTLTVEIEYNPRKTDPEALACAMDRLTETVLSTPGIMDEYGNPTVRKYFVAKEVPTAPATKIVLNISGGALQDVFSSDPAANIILCDWDTEGSDPSDDGIVEIPDGRGDTQLVGVAEHPVQPLEELAGTDAEAALKAAGMELSEPNGPTVTRRWVLYNADTAALLATRMYESYEEAAEDANQIDDIMVLPLVFEELHT